MNSRTQAAIVFLTTIIAAWVQSTFSLSSDDIFTLRVSQLPWAGLIEALRQDVHPPLYFLLVKCWFLVWGPGEFALQAFSGVTFLAAVGAVYFGVPEEDRAAAVVLLNPLGLLTARLGRMYALLLLLSVLAIIFERKQRWRSLAVVHLAGSFTHIWYFFFLAGQGLVAILYRRQPLRYSLVAAASLAPYAVLWLPALLSQLEKSKEAAAWLPAPTLGALGSTLLLLSGFTLLNLVFLRTKPHWSYLVQFALTLAIPFVLSFWKPIFYGRFTIPALAPLAFSFPFRKVPAILGHCCLALVLSAYEWNRAKDCDSVSTAQILKESTRPGESIIFTSLSRAPILHYWPEGAAPSSSFPAEIDDHPGYEPDYRRLKSMPSVAPKSSRVWLLAGFNEEVERRVKTDLEQLGYRGELRKECGAVDCYYQRIFLYTLAP